MTQRRVPGITDGSTEADVVRRFGQADQSEIKAVTKTMNYQKLNVTFTLEKERVYGIGIYQ